MGTYVWVALAGVLTFPLVSALALVPYMIYEYRRYGSIPSWKSIVVFSLIARVVASKVRGQALMLVNAWASGTRLMSLPQIEAARVSADAGVSAAAHLRSSDGNNR